MLLFWFSIESRGSCNMLKWAVRDGGSLVASLSISYWSWFSFAVQAYWSVCAWFLFRSYWHAIAQFIRVYLSESYDASDWVWSVSVIAGIFVGGKLCCEPLHPTHVMLCKRGLVKGFSFLQRGYLLGKLNLLGELDHSKRLVSSNKISLRFYFLSLFSETALRAWRVTVGVSAIIM